MCRKTRNSGIIIIDHKFISTNARCIDVSCLPVDSVLVHWELNDVTQKPVMVYPEVNYYQNYLATLDSMYLSSDSTYKIKAWTIKPNNKTDEDTSNNESIIKKITLIPRPEIITVTPDSICSGNSASLFVESDNTKFYNWYETLYGSNIIDRDSVLKTPGLNTSRTYYFEAASKLRPDSFLSTMFINDPLSHKTIGIMMDIKSKSTDLYIDSFDIQLESVRDEIIWIYYKKNSYDGYSGNSKAWTFADSVIVHGKGYRNLSRVSLSESIKIEQGDTVSIYIYTSTFMYFHHLLGKFSNSDLLIDKAIAMDDNFKNAVTPRINFSGQIYYSNKSYCTTPRIPVNAIVEPIPKLSQIVDTNFCTGDSLIIDAFIGDHFDYEWTKDSSTNILSLHSSLIINTLGYYTVRASNDCQESDTVSFNVKQYATPKAHFSKSKQEACMGKGLTFTNLSSISAGDMTFLWDFGNSDTSSKRNIADYFFDTTGTFNITLKVTSDHGCKNIHIDSALIHPVPVAEINISDSIQCLIGNEFELDDKTIFTQGNYTNYWDLGDGTKLTDQNKVKHSYQLAGIHLVSFEVVSDLACSDSIGFYILVKQNPEFDLGKDTSLCVDSTIIFTVDNSFDNYLWSTNEGSNSISISSDKEEVITVWLKATQVCILS